MADFKDIPYRIRDVEYIKTKANKKLSERIKEIKNIKTKPIRLIILTDEKKDDEFKKFWSESIYSEENEISITIADLAYLKDAFIRVNSSVDNIPEYVELNIGNEDIFEFKTIDENYRTFLVTQQGTKIKNLYNFYKDPLFNYNIRYWLGPNPVNKSMIDTINNEPERFFYYNNGITAVCEEIKKEKKDHGEVLICKNFQVINGAQTFTTIAKEGSSNISSVKILIKIIEAEVGKDIKNPNGLNESIVKNTNNQTAIQVSDFRSNDPIQIFLEKEVKKYQYKCSTPYKNILYKRKRAKSATHKNDFIVTMQDLGKSYYSAFYDPIELNSSVSRLWDTSLEKGLYYIAFGNSDYAKTDFFTKERLNKMLSSHFIFDFIKLKCKGSNKEENPSQLFKYHMLWGIVKLIKDKHPLLDACDTIFNKIAEEGYVINSNLFPKEYSNFNEYYETVSGAINYLISDAESDGVIVMRNLQRSKKFFEKYGNFLNKNRYIMKLPNLI